MSTIRPTKAEVNALVPLLEQDWDSPEDLASALIRAVDQARAERKLYVAVMQFGGGGNGGKGMSGPVWYTGVGPYPGKDSAKKAVLSHPGASLATKIAVVPVVSPAGLELLLRDVG